MYAAFVMSGAGYEVRPLAYGMKLFDLGGHGRMLKAAVAPADGDLAAYGVLEDDKTVLVTVINKQHGAGAGAKEIDVRVDASVAEAGVMFLKATGGDVAAGAGAVTLGGAAIKEDGTWKGEWTMAETLPDKTGATVAVTVPAASAVVVRVKLK